MAEKFDEEKISKEKNKQKELEEERIKTTKTIIKNLEKQKEIEKQHLDLVEEHLTYWKDQLEKTDNFDKERIKELEERLEMEERVYNKIKDHMGHIDKEIKTQKEHIP